VWHYRLISPDGIEIYPLPEAATDDDYDRRSRIIAELNDRHGVPEDWMQQGQSWDVAVLEGELHPKLLAQATLHPVEEVPSGDL
jgi:hypothetical protein